ncbi:MAG: hypothetical protein MZV63_17445 [Marinilabiliales bacterium]|nr:hypothetical protein [Marinilabiliales bacterium]
MLWLFHFRAGAMRSPGSCPARWSRSSTTSRARWLRRKRWSGSPSRFVSGRCTTLSVMASGWSSGTCRLEDHFAGRSNRWVESMRPKAPRSSDARSRPVDAVTDPGVLASATPRPRRGREGGGDGTASTSCSTSAVRSLQDGVTKPCEPRSCEGG